MRILLLIPFVLGVSFVSAQRVIQILSLPESTPPEAELFLASSANGWDPGDNSWRFNSLILEIPAGAPEVFEGKITRGSWETVEGDAAGGFLPNRSFDFSDTDTITIDILSWEGVTPPDDLPENLIIFDEDFYMPTLDRTRRIRVLLPLDYDQTDLHYPVLYMHDGQNLFSDQESFAGEWEVDETLAQFEAEGYPGAIVVAIDNDGQYRIDEYTPYANPTYGGGQGEDYVDFIVNSLKPAIDDSLRTLSDRENTGIMGSSLGGLISFYAAMKYQDVFSKVGVFSPSFWFNDSIYLFADNEGMQESMQFYFLAGGQESETLAAEVTEMIELLEAEGFPNDDLFYDFEPAGEHSEWFWAAEFPDAFQWLYIDSSTGLGEKDAEQEMVIYPNPAGDTLYFLLPEGRHSVDLSIFDLAGRLILSETGAEDPIDISNLNSGTYQIRLSGPDFSYVQSFIKR